MILRKLRPAFWLVLEVTAYVTRSINAMIGLKKVISFAFDQFDHHQEARCEGRDGAQGPPIFAAIPVE